MRWAGAMVAALWALSIAAAQASPGGGADVVEIAWHAPDGCPDEGQVLALIEERLGGSLRVSGGLMADIAVERQPSGRWHMTLRARSAASEGERRVEGATCAEVVEAAALMVVLAVEIMRESPGEAAAPALAERIAITAAAPVLPATVAPPPKAPRPALTGAARSAGRPLEWRVRSVLAYGALELPGAGPGVGVGAGLVRDRVHIDLSAAHWFARARTVDGAMDAGGRFTLQAASVRGCWRVISQAGGCLGAELGALSGRGVGTIEEGEGRALWVAPVAGVLADHALTSVLGLSAGAEYALALRRPRFVLTGLGEVHRPEPGALRLYLGLEARWR